MRYFRAKVYYKSKRALSLSKQTFVRKYHIVPASRPWIHSAPRMKGPTLHPGQQPNLNIYLGKYNVLVLISLLLFFVSSLRRGDQSTVFCIVSFNFNWSRSLKIRHPFTLFVVVVLPLLQARFVGRMSIMCVAGLKGRNIAYATRCQAPNLCSKV